MPKYKKKIKIERVFALPNKWTFKIKPIMKLIKKEMADTKPWIDPFAGMNSPAHIRNDINPDMPAEYHLDALEFVKMFDDESIAGILFDPPYSFHQAGVTYNTDVKALTKTYRSDIKQQMCRILRPNGKAISFGWNSNGISSSQNKQFRVVRFQTMEKTRFLLVAHGAGHNDTIVTVERKIQETLI